MSLFKKAEQQQSYLKAGFYGDAGSGKTWTSSLVALGLHKFIDSKKPITFFDTEAGSEYVLPKLFKPAGVELQSIKSRSFMDLMAAVAEAQQISDILIIDSVTHLWNELQEAFKKKNGITKLEFQHWNILKPEWNRFTTAYLNAPMHVIVCGRSKDDYEYVQDSQGKKELQKTGTRMATEKNLSYEPSLLVEMEKIIDIKTGFWIPRAWILKDRFGEIDGKAFDKPTFETFLPHIKMLNLGGAHVGVDISRNSEALFGIEDGESLQSIRHKQAVYVEQIEGTMDSAYPGRSAADIKKKLDLLNAAFNSFSWEDIKSRPPEVLMMGLQKMKELITADLEKLVKNGANKEEKISKGGKK